MPNRLAGLFTGVALWLVAGTTFGADMVAEKDGLTVSMATPEGKLEPGELPFTIKVKDDGKAVSDARIEIFYGMKPQYGMPPMMYEPRARWDKNGYKTKLNIDMMGDWFIEVTVKRDGGSSRTLKLE